MKKNQTDNYKINASLNYYKQKLYDNEMNIRKTDHMNKFKDLVQKKKNKIAEIHSKIFEEEQKREFRISS